MIGDPAKGVEVFYCYAREDELLRKELEKHLMLLKRQGFITGWHDRNISAGTEWAHEIDTHLNMAQIILLLVSADFLASEYCYSIEMERALEKHNAGEARVIPVILRPVDWEDAPFSKLLVLPTDGKPIESSKWYNRDEAFSDVATGIRKVVRTLLSERQQTEKRQTHQPKEEPIRKVKEVETQLVGKETDSFHSSSVQSLITGSSDLSQVPVDSPALNKKITCPFCFNECSAIDLCFRCKNPHCSGRVPDEVFAKARQETPMVMGKVLTPNKRVFELPKVIECEICKQESRTRICPACHFEFSHDIGQVDQCILSIVGGTNTGKSHYIAALITRLKYEIGKDFNLTVRMIGENTQYRWEKDYYNPLFGSKTILPPTFPGEIDPIVKTPLVFRLTFTNGERRRALNLSLYDLSGDLMGSLDRVSFQARYISRSHGIIFLLDPLQIDAIRPQLGVVGPMPTPDRKAGPEYLVGQLRDLFEWQNNLPADEQINIPIAFTLSKVDMLLPLVAPDSALHRQSKHFGQLDMDDLQTMSTEIASYLSAWVSPNFCNIVHDNFAHYHYFGISSLGVQPDSRGHLEKVSPFRVEDPFLWILYQLGLVEGRKTEHLSV